MSDTSPIILGDEDVVISTLADTTLQTFFDENVTQFLSDVGVAASTTAFGVPEGVIHIESSGGIASTLALGTFAVRPLLTVEAISPTTSFGTPEFISFVEDGTYTKTTAVGNPAVFDPGAVILGDEDTPIEDLSDEQIDSLPQTQLIFEDVVSGGIASTTVVTEDTGVGSPTEPELITFVEEVGAIASTVTHSTDHEIKFVIKEVGAIASTVAFGDSEGIIFIEESGAIASTASAPQVQFVSALIGGANKDVGGIASTASIPTDGGFQGGIFRALIYKEGEISGIGANESMFVAGGIRVNPASRVSLSATSGANSNITVPTNPVGFVSINIQGIDYKIPYFDV